MKPADWNVRENEKQPDRPKQQESEPNSLDTSTSKEAVVKNATVVKEETEKQDNKEATANIKENTEIKLIEQKKNNSLDRRNTVSKSKYYNCVSAVIMVVVFNCVFYPATLMAGRGILMKVLSLLFMYATAYIVYKINKDVAEKKQIKNPEKGYVAAVLISIALTSIQCLSI